MGILWGVPLGNFLGFFFVCQRIKRCLVYPCSSFAVPLVRCSLFLEVSRVLSSFFLVVPVLLWCCCACCWCLLCFSCCLLLWGLSCFWCCGCCSCFFVVLLWVVPAVCAAWVSGWVPFLGGCYGWSSCSWCFWCYPFCVLCGWLDYCCSCWWRTCDHF